MWTGDPQAMLKCKLHDRFKCLFCTTEQTPLPAERPHEVIPEIILGRRQRSTAVVCSSDAAWEPPRSRELRGAQLPLGFLYGTDWKPDTHTPS